MSTPCGFERKRKEMVMNKFVYMMLSLACLGGQVLATDGSASALVVLHSIADGSSVSGAVRIDYVPEAAGRRAVVTANGERVVDSEAGGTSLWYPPAKGPHVLAHADWGGAFTATYNAEAAFHALTYANLKGAAHANPTVYEEGRVFAFSAPDAVAGYTFAGWTPTEVTAEMTGPQTVAASWRLEAPTVTPASGTTFDTSLTVSMSCAAAGATIHYTTDGSEPTVDTPVYRRFRVNGKTTVKAVAVDADGLTSAVTVTEYALGRCVDPVISPTDGTVFQHANQEVSISCGEEGTLRYTLDGSEPTADSPVYAGPFTISETTIVRAKMFSDRFFDSRTVSSTLTREWVRVETPVITAAPRFTGAKTRVALSCTTPGACIHYTLDGSEPTADAPVYAGPFDVSASCTVRAYAALADYTDSEITSFTIEKVWGIGDSLGVPDRVFTISGDAGWVRDTAVSRDGGESMRSGSVTDKQTSVLSTTVDGRGVVSFWWKTSCEFDEAYHDWDHVTFAVDGVEVTRLDGVTDWQEVTHELTTGGGHTLTWTYVKDDAERGGEDCAWVASFAWTPAPVEPSILGDAEAVVTGDAERGFTVRPSAETEIVEVVVPDGLDPAKVTVVVAPGVKTVRANGAAMRVVRGDADITDFLDIPAAAGGVVDLGAAAVKAEIAHAALDVSQGARVELDDPSKPVLTTTPTKRGLVYTLREGTALDAMRDGDRAVGDGAPWTPAVTVKGGPSGFYSVTVGK